MTRAKEAAYLLLRVVTGVLFLQHGGQLLFAWFGGVGGVPGATVPWMSQLGLAGLLEFFGGAAVAFGLVTRPTAFLLSGEMAVAYFQAHQPHGVWPIQNHGEAAVLYSFLFLFFAAHGPGPVSVDALFRRERP